MSAPPLFLGHGECLGHDQLASVGVMAGGVGWGGGDDWQQGDRISLWDPQAWLQVLFPKRSSFSSRSPQRLALILPGHGTLGAWPASKLGTSLLHGRSSAAA